MTLITPKSTVELVLLKKNKHAKFKIFQIFQNKIEIILFYLCIGFLASGVILAGLTYIINHALLVFGALLCVLVSVFFAVGLQIASLTLSFLNSEKALSLPFLGEINDDIDLINELVKISELHHLVFTHKNFLLMAKQLRERIGLLVGALEKVGLIPLATTAYFSFLKAQKEHQQTFDEIGWVFIAFAVLYLFAIRMIGAAHRLEKISEIYEQAVDLKRKSEHKNKSINN